MLPTNLGYWCLVLAGVALLFASDKPVRLSGILRIAAGLWFLLGPGVGDAVVVVLLVTWLAFIFFTNLFGARKSPVTEQNAKTAKNQSSQDDL